MEPAVPPLPRFIRTPDCVSPRLETIVVPLKVLLPVSTSGPFTP